MAFLDRLLDPYRAAQAGTPATEGNLSADPLYASLFAQPTPQPQRGGGGPGGGILELLYGPDVPGHASHLHLAAKRVLPILKRIDRMRGFNVSEHPFFDPVDPVHVENSWHYKNKAGDVNYLGGGRFSNESQALQWLENWISKNYG